MTAADIDRRLAELRDAAERIGTNLVDMELETDLNPVGVALLQGESAIAWAAARETQLKLWHWYGLLTTQLERAVELRGARSHVRKETLAQLEELLGGASIELQAGDVPLSSRGLLGASWSVERCTCDELLARMAETFAESTGLLARFASAWDVLAPRVRTAELRVRELGALAATLGVPGSHDLDVARHGVSALEESLAKDPLTVDPAAVEQLESSIDRLADSLARLGEFRRAADGRLDAAQRLLDELVLADRRCAEAHAEVERKIARPAAPPAPTLGPRAGLELDGIRVLVASGAWDQARIGLEQWSARVGALVERVRVNTAETLAPLESRNELRGRLQAYQAKATRLGVVEDEELREAFERALDALYVAPADLERAEQFVLDYQRRLAQHRATREVLS
jgi:hypothetical protein